MPPTSKILTEGAVARLPPMLFGKIRWNKGYGSPVGDPCSGFRVSVKERTVIKYQNGPSGPEPDPKTGIWKVTTASAPCSVAPDEGNMHVVRFTVPDVHLNGYPGGEYWVKPELTGNWQQSGIQTMLGFKRIDPLSYHVSLTPDRHIVSLDFEVTQHAWSFYMTG
jgi:hypothetical protein